MAKKKSKKQKQIIYKGFACKLVDKWVAPEDGGAPILSMPNVPHPLHTCLMPDAEVLTPHGWKRIDSVEIGDTVACWSEDGVLFDQVQDTVKAYCTHNYKIGFDKAKNFDMVYSPSHRIPLYYEEHYHGRRKEKLPEPKMNFFVRTAEEFCPNSHTHFITASNSLYKENHLTPEERIFIAIQADGSLKRDNKTDRTYCLKFVKSRKTQRLMELLKESSLKWTYSKTSGVDVFHVRTDKKDYKCFEGIFNIAEFSYEKAREFINETTLWDGHNGKSVFGTSREYYCSTNYENVGFVQAVAMLGGFTTATYTRPATSKHAECKTVWFMDKLYRRAGHIKKQIQPYNDLMYCITVPTSFFIVRYHDVVMVTGNCAPRTIFGVSTWNHMRNRCYYMANYTCEACGAKVKTEYYDDGSVHHKYHDDGTIAKRNLHAHELYTYDYNKGTAKFERCVALCECCVDEDTEVLTKDGWKKIPQVTTDDVAACWDKSGSITFQQPTATIEMEAEYINKITGKGATLFFSDGHRMPLKVASKQSPKYGEVVDVLAKDYKSSHYYNWLTGGDTVGNDHLTDLERLYIAIEADGHLNWDKEHPVKSEDGKRSRGYNSRYGSENYRYTYSISLYKSRKIERFKKLLETSGLKYQIIKSSKKDYCDFNVWTNVECKHFANCFSQEMSSQKALEFIEELVFWDGTFSKGKTAWFTNKKEEVDFVQGVAAQCNVATSIQVVNRIGNIRKGEWNTPYDKLTYSVAFHSIRNEYSARDMKAERVKWGKKVYCITVPTSYFIARRDGFVFVTGNCHVRFIHSGRMFTMFKKGDPLMTPERVLEGLEHGFKLISDYNKEHKGSEKLRVYYAVLDYVDDERIGSQVWDLIDKYNIEFYIPDGEMYPKGVSVWEGWKLIIGDKEYPSPFHSQKEWEEAMEKNNEQQMVQRMTWMNRFKKYEGLDAVDITDDDMKKINNAKIPDGF